MEYLPIFVRLEGRPCLVVGGGEVAARKVGRLLAAGARVEVVAPRPAAAVRALADAGRITLREAAFDPTRVGDPVLVIAATDDPATNRAVADAAARAGRLCNVVDDPDPSTFISPSIVERGPLVIAISSGGAAPLLARLLRQQLERLLPARLGDLAGWARRWRRVVRERFPDTRGRRRFWEQVFDGEPAQRLMAGDTAAADAALRAALDAAPRGMPTGEAALVGAGPGDPELITLRGFRRLQQADVILHDRLASPRLLDHARQDALCIDVGKTGGGPSTDQAEINRLLVAHVAAGRRVCRLKGGDPYLFGRGGEEAAALAAAGLRFEVVPGVTAAGGCSAAAGIPLTHRGLADAVTFVTAERTGGDEPDWAHLAAAGHTLVVYMVTRRLAAVAAALVAHGRPGTTPAALVSGGTTPAQQVVHGTLADIGARAAAAPSPGLLIVGDVVALAGRLTADRPAPVP